MSSKGPDACHGHPSHHNDGDGNAHLSDGADNRRAESNGVDVVDGTCVGGCEGEGLHDFFVGALFRDVNWSRVNVYVW